MPNNDKDRYIHIHDNHERKRLELQSRYYQEMTRNFLTIAGVRPGMRVLDLGCGTGGVAALVSELLDGQGNIVCLDQNEDCLKWAKENLEASGVDMKSVRFVQGDIDSLPGELVDFDAIVGRLILMYSRSIPDALNTYRQRVKPGGLLAFQEADHTKYFSTDPPSELYGKYRDHIMSIAIRCGFANKGQELLGHFHSAGLIVTGEVRAERVESGPDSDVYRLLASSYWGTVRKQNIKDNEKEMEESEFLRNIEELTQKLRDDAIKNNARVYSSELVGVYGTPPLISQ